MSLWVKKLKFEVIFDVLRQNLTSDIKIWRNRCVHALLVIQKTQILASPRPTSRSQSGSCNPRLGWLGCHILQHFNFSLLPKHFLVQFDERIPKMPKKFNLVDVCPWKIIVLGAYNNHIMIPSEANFTHRRFSLSFIKTLRIRHILNYYTILWLTNVPRKKLSMKRAP